MARGDHIYVDRGIYTHHGVDLGGDAVIELTPLEGDKTRATVQQVRISADRDRAGRRKECERVVLEEAELVGSRRKHRQCVGAGSRS